MVDTSKDSSPTDNYAKVDTIDLPGGVGGHGDIVSYDRDTNAIWVSQSPDNNEIVINPKNDTVKAVIPNIGDANGVAFSPKYAFVADPTYDTLDVISKNTLKIIDRIPVSGTTPDGVAYIPKTKQVTVASDDANTLEFIKAKAPFSEVSITQLIPNPSPPGPDVQAYSSKTDRIYQPDDQDIDVINPHTGEITKTFDVLSSGNVKPPVYDPKTNHLIVGTTDNELLVVNATKGTILKTIPINGPVDEGVIDPATRTAFFASKVGQVYAVNLNTDTLVGTIPTEVGTHTLAVDPTNNDLYVYEGDSNTVDVYSQDHIPCFASGTLIRAMRNGAPMDVAVEALELGDLIVTASGGRRLVLWLGHRKVNCRQHPRPHEVMPVRIAANAFGTGLPARDLDLSPGHPVLVGADANNEGGCLVPIMCLINGTTVRRAAIDAVTYWHVGLDQHDVLLAEGLPAESYIDLGSQPWFAGADGALYDPDLALPGMPGRCRPVAIDGPVVDAERRRLDAVFATRLAGAAAWPVAENALAL